MNNRKHHILFILVSSIVFSCLILTYNNFHIIIGPLYSEKPVINVDPEMMEEFSIYKLFKEEPPFNDIVELVDTVNLRIPFTIVNGGFIPSSIERINYKIRVNGNPVLSGTITIGEELLPTDDYVFNISLRIPIPKDIRFLNQLFYSNGFLNLFIEGVAYLRIGGIPVLKPISFGIDISLIKIVQTYFSGEELRFPTGKLEILDVKWVSNGTEVISAKPNTLITVTIVATAVGDDFEGTVDIYVYKDLVFFPNEIYAGRRYNLYIREGEIVMLTFSFKTPPEYEVNLIGFYIVVDRPNQGILWSMPSEYPPRLKADK